MAYVGLLYEPRQKSTQRGHIEGQTFSKGLAEDPPATLLKSSSAKIQIGVDVCLNRHYLLMGVSALENRRNLVASNAYVRSRSADWPRLPVNSGRTILMVVMNPLLELLKFDSEQTNLRLLIISLGILRKTRRYRCCSARVRMSPSILSAV